MRIIDWSSDVCSSDLAEGRGNPVVAALDCFATLAMTTRQNRESSMKLTPPALAPKAEVRPLNDTHHGLTRVDNYARSEARRVGKGGVSERRYLWSPYP